MSRRAWAKRPASSTRPKRSRNKRSGPGTNEAVPEQTKARLGFPLVETLIKTCGRQSGDGRGASLYWRPRSACKGRHEDIRDPCGTSLRGVAGCRTSGDAEWPSAIGETERSSASADNRRVLHRGNDGDLLQCRRWPEYRRLWRKKRLRNERRVGCRRGQRWGECRRGRWRPVVDSALPVGAAIQRILQLIDSGQKRRAGSRHR
jgi:hypothetical protein